ncbi:MAG: VanZ family protein [Tepidisphaeraceae bacterium]
MKSLRTPILIVAIAYVVLLVTITHLPASTLPKTGVSDKTEHFLAYLLLTLLASAVSRVLTGRVRVLPVLIGVCVFGALDEITQPPFNRVCDIRDWYADASAATVGTLGAWAVSRRSKHAESGK